MSFWQPLFSFVVAAFLVAALLLVARRRRTGSTGSPIAARYLPEHRAIRLGAAAVIVAVVIENVVRAYLLNLANVVEWWQYATPVFASLASLSVVLGLIVVRGTTRPEQPTVPTARRTWTSFGSRAGLIGAVAVWIALLGTTVAAGLASSSDQRGRFIHLEIPVPNESIEPLRPWFYGWAYGVPVIACLAALTVVVWLVLRSNAVRPFLRPETVGAEQGARTEIASATVRIATAGMLLALAGAWRFIARSGTLSALTIEGDDGHSDSYQTIWQYAEFATVAGWLAPALEIVAFVLLLLVAVGLHRRHAVARPAERASLTPVPEPEVAR